MGRRNQLAAVNQTFNPASIGSLYLWLDGADTSSQTVISNGISEWRDKSGGDRHVTQATAGNRPTQSFLNGLPAVRFTSASSQTLSRAGSFLDGNPAFTTFVVFQKLSSLNVTPFGWGSQNTGGLFLLFPSQVGGSASSYSFGGATTYPFVLNNGDPDTFHPLNRTWFDCFVKPAGPVTNASAFRSGQFFPSAGASTATPNISGPLVIGQTPGVAAQVFDGLIGEILVYNKALTPDERQQVEQYISKKWQITLANYKLATSVAAPAVASPLDIPNCAIWLDGADTSTMYTGSAGPVTAVTAPTDITGCIGWWDASDASSITQSGGLISQWNDKSGNGKHATASGTTRPTYTGTRNGRNVVTFDGTGNRMNTTLVDSATQTILFVAKATAASAPGTRRVVSYQAERGFFASSGWNWFSPNAGTGVSPTDYNVAGGVITNDTSMLVYGNGVAVSAAFDPFNAGATTFVIGGENASTVSNLFQGEIAEVVVFSSALSTANRARVERYLSLKWGVPGVHAPVTGTGEPVGYWANKAGNDFNFFAATAAARASLSPSRLNNISPVEFNGTTSTLECSSFNFSGNEISAFCVYQVDNQSTGPIVWDYNYTTSAANQQGITGFSNAAGVQVNSTGGIISRIEALRSFTAYAGGGGNSTLATRRAAISSLVGTFSTSPTRAAWFNSVLGVVSAATRYNGNIWPLFTLGTRRSSGTADVGSLFLGGRIAEFIVYSRAVTDAERARIERYLNNKWGVGLIPPVASHPDAQRWVQQVYLNGGTCSQNTVDAVSSFCREIDSAGLRSKFYRLNLFCGNELIACRTPLYRGPNANERHGFDLDVLTVGSGGSSLFSNTDYTEYGISGGLAGRLQTTTNSNAGPGLRTGIVPAFIPAFYGPQRPAAPSYNYSSLHLATYIRKLRTQTLTAGYLLGAYGGVGATFDPRHGAMISVNQNAWRVGPFSADVSGAYDNVDRGLYVADIRVTNELIANDYVNELTLYAGGMRYATGRLSLGPFLHPDIDFGIFGECRATIAYSQTDNSLFRAEQTMQGYSIGLGMTEAEAQAYSQIMNRFQNRLGRGLPENTMPAFATISNLDTQDWLTRVYAAGGNVSTSTAEAVQTFCNAITSAGIRDRFFRLNLFCGNNLEACVVPLYRGPTRTGTQYGGLTDRNSNFVSTDYVEHGAAGGLKGNGTNKLLDTGLLGSLLLPGDRHASAYESLAATSDYSPSVLAVGGSSTNMHGVGPWTSPTQYRYRTHNTVGGNPVTTNANGMWLGSDTSSTASVLYRNGASVATATGQPAGGAGAGNYQILGHSSGEWSEARLGGYSIGLSMAAAQITAFYNAMQTFQTALSRNV
jgi:hypothetical protein